MSQLELTITVEQVKNFLGGDDFRGDNFESFLDDSQSPDPTNGKANYGRHILRLSNDIEILWRIVWDSLPLPNDLREFFDKIIEVANLFERSLQALTYDFYSTDKEKELQEHYDSLAQLVPLYQRGIELKQQYPNVPELKIATDDIRYQITIANILFDPEKRIVDFQHMMWGPSDRFDKYLDTIQ